MSFTQTKLQRDFPSLQLNSWKVCLLCAHPVLLECTVYYWNALHITG